EQGSCAHCGEFCDARRRPALRGPLPIARLIPPLMAGSFHRQGTSNGGADVARGRDNSPARAVGGMNHAETFFAAAAQICHDIAFASIEALASELDRLRDRKGRLFLIRCLASSAGSKPTARLTTSRSSPHAPMTRDGIRSLQHGSTPVISATS